MKDSHFYIRVGTIYYKLIERPQISGDKGKLLSKTMARKSFTIFRNMMVFAVFLII